MAELTQAQQDQREVLVAFLNEYGLGDLIGNAETWIRDSFSADRIDLEMRKTPAFKQAFPEIAKLQELGKPAVSVESVINYRKEVKRTLINAGLPPGFYDQPGDFVDLMAVKDLSPQEIETRVMNGYARVNSAPQEVKDAFNSFFGASGENNLAMFFLDPVRGEAELMKQTTQAEISGTGKRFGYDIDQGLAERLRSTGTDLSTATQGFDQLSQVSFADETIGEGADLTETEMVAGAFGADAEAKRRTARRAEERSAASRGQGGPSQTQEGFGLGSAR